MKKLYVELANTPIKRSYGLMDRKSLRTNAGMLFKFPREDYLGFWMSNTYIPLDIAFIADDGRVLQIEAMTPLSTRQITSRNRCKYALEVNRGWFDNNNIDVGSYIGGLGIRRQAQVQAQGLPTIPTTPMASEDDSENPFTKMPPVDALQGDQSIDAALPEGQPQEVSPDVMINMSFTQILEDAEIKDKKLLIVYQTKGGVTLPPKVISPPFTFEKNENGEAKSLVKVWDEQDGGWKSFLIDNIIALEEKPESI